MYSVSLSALVDILLTVTRNQGPYYTNATHIKTIALNNSYTPSGPTYNLVSFYNNHNHNFYGEGPVSSLEMKAS